METATKIREMEILKILREKGWYLTIDGLKKVDPDLIQSKDVNGIIANIINLDFHDIAGGALPSEHGGRIPGRIVLQLQNSCNISASSSNRESAPRLLQLELTDGQTTITALELEQIPWLRSDLPPGTKIYFRPETLHFLGRCLILRGSEMEVLGGSVEEMVKTWELDRKMQNDGRDECSVSSASEPPPWIPFGNKLNLPAADQQDFKSKRAARAGGKKSEQNEFNDMRNKAITEATEAGRKKVFGGGGQEKLSDNIKKLLEKGYTENAAREALRTSHNNLQRALKKLKQGRVSNEKADYCTKGKNSTSSAPKLSDLKVASKEESDGEEGREALRISHNNLQRPLKKRKKGRVSNKRADFTKDKNSANSAPKLSDLKVGSKEMSDKEEGKAILNEKTTSEKAMSNISPIDFPTDKLSKHVVTGTVPKNNGAWLSSTFAAVVAGRASTQSKCQISKSQSDEEPPALLATNTANSSTEKDKSRTDADNFCNSGIQEPGMSNNDRINENINQNEEWKNCSITEWPIENSTNSNYMKSCSKLQISGDEPKGFREPIKSAYYLNQSDLQCDTRKIDKSDISKTQLDVMSNRKPFSYFAAPTASGSTEKGTFRSETDNFNNVEFQYSGDNHRINESNYQNPECKNIWKYSTIPQWPAQNPPSDNVEMQILAENRYGKELYNAFTEHSKNFAEAVHVGNLLVEAASKLQISSGEPKGFRKPIKSPHNLHQIGSQYDGSKILGFRNKEINERAMTLLSAQNIDAANVAQIKQPQPPSTIHFPSDEQFSGAYMPPAAAYNYISPNPQPMETDPFQPSLLDILAYNLWQVTFGSSCFPNSRDEERYHEEEKTALPNAGANNNDVNTKDSEDQPRKKQPPIGTGRPCNKNKRNH